MEGSIGELRAPQAGTVLRRRASKRSSALAKYGKENAIAKAKQRNNEPGFAKIVEDGSRAYGYSLIGALANTLCTLGLSSLPLTQWLDDDSASEGELKVPHIHRWGWGLGIYGNFVLVFAVLCTFGCARKPQAKREPTLIVRVLLETDKSTRPSLPPTPPATTTNNNTTHVLRVNNKNQNREKPVSTARIRD